MIPLPFDPDLRPEEDDFALLDDDPFLFAEDFACEPDPDDLDPAVLPRADDADFEPPEDERADLFPEAPDLELVDLLPADFDEPDDLLPADLDEPDDPPPPLFFAADDLLEDLPPPAVDEDRADDPDLEDEDFPDEPALEFDDVADPDFFEPDPDLDDPDPAPADFDDPADFEVPDFEVEDFLVVAILFPPFTCTSNSTNDRIRLQICKQHTKQLFYVLGTLPHGTRVESMRLNLRNA